MRDVPGGGPAGRVSEDDVKRFSRSARNAPAPAADGQPAQPPPLPDFSRWGAVQREPLTRFRRTVARNMALAWEQIPAVTLHHTADVTELEAMRQRYKQVAIDAGGRLTITAILLKIVASALRAHPRVNSSFDVETQELVVKQYVHIGVAVDTDRGLVVPVISDVDQKNIIQLGVELTALSEKARQNDLTIEEMRGSSFTITNLGGLGTGHFAPIIHWPNVAILAVGRAERAPVWVGRRATARRPQWTPGWRLAAASASASLLHLRPPRPGRRRRRPFHDLDHGRDQPAADAGLGGLRWPLSPAPPNDAPATNGGKRLAVIGAGPGGYPAAFHAALRGLDVTLIDTEDNPGGVCTYRGCIPSKALLHAARVIEETREAGAFGIRFGEPQIDLDALREWKDGVVRRLTSGLGMLRGQRNVTPITGYARFADNCSLRVLRDGALDEVGFDHAIIATGSSPLLPGPLQLDSPRVMDSTAALELAGIPQRLLVIGGGYIGLELGTVYAALGSKVTVVEMLSGLLMGVDRDLVKPLAARLDDAFDEILLNTKVTGMEEVADGIRVRFSGADVGESERVFDKVLVAVGRRPNSGDLALETTRVRLDSRGFIETDAPAAHRRAHDLRHRRRRRRAHARPQGHARGRASPSRRSSVSPPSSSPPPSPPSSSPTLRSPGPASPRRTLVARMSRSCATPGAPPAGPSPWAATRASPS